MSDAVPAGRLGIQRGRLNRTSDQVGAVTATGPEVFGDSIQLPWTALINVGFGDGSSDHGDDDHGYAKSQARR